MLGVGALLVTDTLCSIIQLTGGYHSGSPIETGWMTWYACWGATVLHPTMRDLADLSRRRVTRGDLAGGRELLDSLEEDIRGEVAALRRVMVELRPPALDEWGLVAALGDHAATFRQQTGIACTVEAELPVRLAGAQETVLTGSSRRP